MARPGVDWPAVFARAQATLDAAPFLAPSTPQESTMTTSPFDSLPHVLVTYRGDEGENEYVDDVYGPFPDKASAMAVESVLRAYGGAACDVKILTPPRETELPAPVPVDGPADVCPGCGGVLGRPVVRSS